MWTRDDSKGVWHPTVDSLGPLPAALDARDASHQSAENEAHKDKPSVVGVAKKGKKEVAGGGKGAAVKAEKKQVRNPEV